MMRKTTTKTKKTIVIATAITTLLSATAALAIKVFHKPKKEETVGFNAVLEGLVKDGTITEAQEVTIRAEYKAFMEGQVKDDTITQAQETTI